MSSLEDCCKVALDFECETHLSLKIPIQGGYERFDLSRFDYYGVARDGKNDNLTDCRQGAQRRGNFQVGIPYWYRFQEVTPSDWC